MPRHNNDWDNAGYFAYFPPPSTPRRVKGGIKAESQRGAFGQSWWAKRWIGVLERFDIGTRLSRGRSYARNGQVLDITITPGRVAAKVQGSQARPYNVAITIKQLRGDDWRRVVQAIGDEALLVAQLLNGVMPQDIESAFAAASVSLFPAQLNDITTSCSCPDWSNPCKHVAAVYYLLGEEFDRDPFLLFALRGMERTDLITLLGTFQETAEAAAASPDEPSHHTIVAVTPEPLPIDSNLFWGDSPAEKEFLEADDTAPIPPVVAHLPKRLGRLPFWRGERDMQAELVEMYEAAAGHSLNLLIDDRHRRATG